MKIGFGGLLLVAKVSTGLDQHLAQDESNTVERAYRLTTELGVLLDWILKASRVYRGTCYVLLNSHRLCNTVCFGAGQNCLSAAMICVSQEHVPWRTV